MLTKWLRFSVSMPAATWFAESSTHIQRQFDEESCIDRDNSGRRAPRDLASMRRKLPLDIPVMMIIPREVVLPMVSAQVNE